MAPASINGKANPQQSRQRGKNRATNAAAKTTDQHASTNGPRKVPTSLSLELLQIMLNVFKNTFLNRYGESLGTVIQDVKQHLFNRDFAEAFSKHEYLDAYVMRWSPSRALAYLDIFATLRGFPLQLQPHLHGRLHDNSDTTGHSDKNLAVALSGLHGERIFPMEGERTMQSRVVSLGGGAGAEMVALVGLLYECNRLAKGESTMNAEGDRSKPSLDITVVDVADWSSVITQLQTNISSLLAVPAYRSDGDLVKTMSTVEHSSFRVSFLQQDLFKMQTSQLDTLLKDCTLVTLMFTLNELYSTSMSATTNFLLSMTDIMKSGSLLLVVDSSGSYSTVDVNVAKDTESQATEITQRGCSKQKKYPMLWLLDHTLLDTAGIGRDRLANEKQWEKLEGNDSKWFRLPPGLKYPIDLENLRYQMHLYRRL